MSLWLGTDLSDLTTRIELPLEVLVRHMGIFGSQGSGKTTLAKIIMEDAAKLGVPIIAIDPQGDVASLARLVDERNIEASGLPLDMLREYRNRVQVNIFTPGSSKGRRIGLDPLTFPKRQAGMDDDEVIQILDNNVRTLVKVLVKLCGLKSSQESNAVSCLYKIMEAYTKKGFEVRGFEHLARIVTNDDLKLIPDMENYMSLPDRRNLAKALRALTVGSRQLLFSAEEKIDIDKLIQHVNGKTPINVLFLKTLPTEEEKMFFVTIFVTKLYEWMVRQGSSSKTKLILFIDEVGPYIPSGSSRPAPRDTLLLVFRQARKYGVMCVACSQSPKDVEYRAFEQMSTHAIGRLATKQSIEAIAKIVSAVAGETEASRVLDALPALVPGQFVLVSPGMKQAVTLVKARPIVTRHETLDAHAVKRLKEKAMTENEEPTEETEQPAAERSTTPDTEPKVATAEETQPTTEVSPTTEETQTIHESAATQAVREQKALTPSEIVLSALKSRLEKVAETRYGLDLFRELIENKKLDYELACHQYLAETRRVLRTGLGAKRMESEETYLVYDFETLLAEVVKTTSVPAIDIDPADIKDKFEDLVFNAKKGNALIRTILRKSGLKYD